MRNKIKNNFKYFKIIKFKKSGITVQQIAISGLMLSLITVLKLLEIVMPKTPLGYSWVEFYMIFATILVLTMPFATSFLVLISAPFLWLAIGQTSQMSPLSFFLDYTLPILSILLIYVARFIKEKNPKQIFSIRKIVIFFLVIISFVFKWFLHSLSGVVAWETPWGASASLNAPMVFTTLAATIVVTTLMLPKISLLQNFVNRKGTRW